MRNVTSTFGWGRRHNISPQRRCVTCAVYTATKVVGNNVYENRRPWERESRDISASRRQTERSSVDALAAEIAVGVDASSSSTFDGCSVPRVARRISTSGSGWQSSRACAHVFAGRRRVMNCLPRTSSCPENVFARENLDALSR